MRLSFQLGGGKTPAGRGISEQDSMGSGHGNDPLSGYQMKKDCLQRCGPVSYTHLLAISYISDKTVFCQYSCPLINLFRFVQHKQFRSFGYFGKDITFDTCFPADRRIFLYCDNILASEGRHNPYTVRFLPVLIRKIRIFLKEIQRHIGITAIRA